MKIIPLDFCQMDAIAVMRRLILVAAVHIASIALVSGKGQCDAMKKATSRSEVPVAQNGDPTSKDKRKLIDIIVPPEYDKHEPPTINGNPVRVEVGISVAAITEVREHTLDVDFVAYLLIRWYDCRLNYNFTGPRVLVSYDDFGEIWRPDLYFRNVKRWSHYDHIQNRGYANFYNNNEVIMSGRYLVTSMCKFDFKKYPFDSQECGLDIESYAHTMEEVHLEFNTDVEMDSTMPPLPQFDIKSVSGVNCTLLWDFGDSSGMYGCLGFVVKFQRRYHYFIWQVYLPSGILVVISWLSFWIDVNAIPGRVTLVITTLLTLATQFSTIQKSLPPVSYLKAIDVWIFSCMIFVFLSLVEFVAALTLEKRPKKGLKQLNGKMMKMPANVRRVFPKYNMDGNAAWSPSLIRPLSTVETLRKRSGQNERALHIDATALPGMEIRRKHENAVDKIAKGVFFLLFFVFNAIYWCIFIS